MSPDLQSSISQAVALPSRRPAGAGVGPEAFTLVELLIVIAIVALLAALILPALSAAQARSKQVACVNQLKQLALGSKMYAADNSEKLLENEPTHPVPDNWVFGNMKVPDQSTNASFLRQAQLFPYASQPAIYHCPADLSQTGGHPRARSYSMNSWMGSRFMETYSAANRYRTFVKENEIATAGSATLWLLADEHEATIDDGRFVVPMDNAQPLTSLPAARHQRGYVLNFADAHVEYFKLRNWNPGAIDAAYGQQNQDLARLRQVTTVQ